jgi:hypothetical protein
MFTAINTLARFIVTYYWLFVSSSFSFFFMQVAIYQKHATVIEFSYYALYLVVGGLTRHLLLTKIPATFLLLRDTGAFKEGAIDRLMKSTVHGLERPLGYVLGVLLAAVILFWFYGLDEWKQIHGMDWFWSAVLETGVVMDDVLLAYAGGVAIGIVAVTAWEFHYLGQTRELIMQPFHPDRCAGLASIGQLFFFSSIILIVIALFFGGWLLFGGWFLYGKGSPGFDLSYREFQPWFAGTLIGVGLVSIAVFFLPLLNIHGMMTVEAAEYTKKVLRFAAEIADLEQSLVASASSGKYEELDTRLTQIESLRKAYREYADIPTWPVDFQTRWQFFTAQLALWISVLTLTDKIKSLAGPLMR